MNRALPTQAYVDTSVAVAAIVPGIPHSAASAAFCDGLAAQHSSVYFSQIVRLELSQAVRNLATRPGQVPFDMWSNFPLAQWGASPLVRQRWLEFGSRQFESLIRRFALAVEIPFDVSIWHDSVGVMAAYGLRSLDAIHVATARRQGLRHLATLDDDFRRVRDLDVWLLRDPTP